MSRVVCFFTAMSLLIGTCEAAVFSWTVQPTAMVGGFTGNLANVSSTGIPTGNFNPDPTSYSTGDSSAGRLKGEQFLPTSYSTTGPGAANYQVHSKVDAIWGTKLDFAAQSEVVSNPTPFTVTVKSMGEFFFSVSNSASGTYKVSTTGTVALWKFVGSSWTPFASSGSIADVNGDFKVVFDVTFTSTALATIGNKTDLLTLEQDQLTPPVVPEPASMAVFGLLGIAGVAARRFRKK